MGVLAALAGLIFAARLNVATPKAGLGFELDVIAACFIGGASTTGGVGKVIGAVIGAFIMGVMNNGMSIMGIDIDWQQVIKGAGAAARRVLRRLQQEQGLSEQADHAAFAESTSRPTRRHSCASCVARAAREGAMSSQTAADDSVRDLRAGRALGAARAGQTLAAADPRTSGFGEAVDLDGAYAEGRVLLADHAIPIPRTCT